MDHHDNPSPHHDELLAQRLAVPGDEPPLVWRTAPPRQPGCLATQVAQRLLDELTQVGDMVLDIDDDHVFATAAAASGRRHHALGGDLHPATLRHAAGYLDLVLLHWPRPATNLHWLLDTCRTMLGATSRLVIAATLDAASRVAHLSALGGAAATAGLRQCRHIAVVAPQVATPDPMDTPPGGATVAFCFGEPASLPGATPHTDLLILDDPGSRHV